MHKEDTDEDVTRTADYKTFDSFIDAVQYYAVNNTIVVASFDITYVSMALNLFLTSFRKFNIKNHLFVASDRLGCAELLSHDAHCIQYMNLSISKNPSYFDQPDYNEKACIKPKIVLDCLKAGFHVLLVDVDIIFLKNPLPFISNYSDCDFVTQTDPLSKEENSGFYLVKASSSGMKLFTKIVEMINGTSRGDQDYVNDALHELEESIKIHRLSPEIYQLGKMFFNKGRRAFAGDNPCINCIIVHNNYIVSLEAKIYRFKEYGMWSVDIGGYYSDKTRKYIKYGNPIDFGAREEFGCNNTMEEVSLKTALIIGHILNRTVIMPRFHCGRKIHICHFGFRFSVRSFELHLPVLETYRENVFLEHPLVPESTKKSVSEMFVFDNPIWQTLTRNAKNQTTNVKVMKTEQYNISDSDIKRWFGSETSQVLQFYSLYNEIFCEDSELSHFYDTLNDAIQASNPMQFRQDDI
ncbi:hypothetical protein LSH36_32g10008 [Paralvinella palmiformis]|uniref:Nucleotide-diphospho-sugar transferase domain-containing protein n=1 Tax=Paralvinella palmiformis TaxID=53620 RepID=A0AAD9NG60_9ANNE|nr:hypothetical protein LSH36_32g10008 [Paralvinella palmiformis]